VTERRITGGILILLGAVALFEAQRLTALREELVAGAVVGDDTFARIIGAALLLMGLYAIFVARWPAWEVKFPARAERRKLVMSAGALFAYFLVNPFLGYPVSTLLVSTVLYRAMGGYRWPVAILIGGVTTGVLFLIFRVWLVVSLPTGLIGI